MRTRCVIILGSTGSIGRQTVEVIAHLNSLADRGKHPVRHEIVGLAAGSDADALLAQATALDVRDIALANGGRDENIRGVHIRRGPDAAERLIREVECDIVVAAIVGSAGLPATLAAVELGRDIALANKETLVAAGEIVTAACRRTGSRLLPVDSEHSGVWQSLLPLPLGGGQGEGQPSPASLRSLVPPLMMDAQISRLILTASGGALRDWPVDRMRHATPEQALAHPTWSMGAKVTIDSASLTNKALELIEAHWLFGLDSPRLAALIHPQSIIHSILEFADGSCLAQMGSPDMRTPIQFALTFPHHQPGRAPRIDWRSLSRLDLSTPDPERFPALRLGHRVIETGGTAGAVFNAANEAAVEAFLARRIPFGRIADLSAAALNEVGASPVRSLTDVFEADREARRFAANAIGGAVRPLR